MTGSLPPIPVTPIGVIRSVFTDRFGIPRQPNLVTAAEARLILLPPYDREEALDGLDGFSHIWLLFLFHTCVGAGWRPKVRPPRLGGRRKIGVFASRAPYRPNPIGLSAVEYLGFDRTTDGLTLRLRGVDMLDGTPVLDIKPYLRYADAIPTASAGFADAPPCADQQVLFTNEAQSQLLRFDPDGARQLQRLIVQTLRLDPRPGYMDRYPDRTEFAMRLADLEIGWRQTDRAALVYRVAPAATGPAGSR